MGKAVDELKSRIDDLFIFVSQVEYKVKHPLRIILASKSLIGINLEKPPRNLLKWLDHYVKDFTPNFNPPSLVDQNLSPETITYTHLWKLILNRKKNESNIYLTHLLQVADPRHIAEFFMELGAQHSPESFLFCWSAFRSIQFLGEKEGYSILYHCLSNLLEKVVDKKSNTNLLLNKYELYCHQFQIRKTEIIRKNKIIPNLDKMIQGINQELSQMSPLNIPISLGGIIRKEGVGGIISYLSNIKIDDISTDLILLLDALRSVLKFSDNPEDPVLLRILNNNRKKDNVN